MPRKSRNGKRRTTSRRNRQAPMGEYGPKGSVALGPMVPRADFLLRNIASVPQSTRRTLVFAYSSNVTATSGTYVEANVMNLNSAFDPNGGTSAAQPAGYVNLMQQYTKCFVLGARIKVKFVNTIDSSEIIACCLAGLTISTLGTSLGTYVAAMQAGLCDWDVIGTFPDHRVFMLSVDIAKFLDKPRVLDDPQLFSTVSANPGQLVTAHFWLRPYFATTVLVYGFEIEQDCIFTDPQPFS